MVHCFVLCMKCGLGLGRHWQFASVFALIFVDETDAVITGKGLLLKRGVRAYGSSRKEEVCWPSVKVTPLSHRLLPFSLHCVYFSPLFSFLCGALYSGNSCFKSWLSSVFDRTAIEIYIQFVQNYIHNYYKLIKSFDKPIQITCILLTILCLCR